VYSTTKWRVFKFHILCILGPFLDIFAKLRKATISFVMSVRLSVRSHGTIQLPLNGFHI
jgi:hypothetical protein